MFLSSRAFLRSPRKLCSLISRYSFTVSTSISSLSTSLMSFFSVLFVAVVLSFLASERSNNRMLDTPGPAAPDNIFYQFSQISFTCHDRRKFIVAKLLQRYFPRGIPRLPQGQWPHAQSGDSSRAAVRNSFVVRRREAG